MARKVFISFLGTNNYLECIYDFGKEKSFPVRFVQEAIVSYLCKDWTENDRIIIFCTSFEITGVKGSKELNWLDNGQLYAQDTVEKIGLEHRLNDLKNNSCLKPQVEMVEIDAGFSEGEIWNIFDSVYSKLAPEDHIYFDATHAFRSIPLFSIVLFNHSKLLKDTNLEAIMYGAFEKLGTVSEVRKMPVEKRVAPIIDLTNIIRLQEYNQIATYLKYFGKTGPIKELILNNQSKEDFAINNFCTSISELDEYITTISLNDIKQGKFIAKFKSNYKYYKRNIQPPKPILNILEKLNEEIHNFTTSSSFENIEAAIEWTINHDMLMQTYSLTLEYVALRLADLFKSIKPKKLENKKFREFITSILGMPEEDFKNSSWGYSLAKYPETAAIIVSHVIICRIRPLYEPIRSCRNALDHGNGNISYDALKAGIDNVKNCLRVLKDEVNRFVLIIPAPLHNSLFLNLSNHPSSQWDEKQFAAAREYGEIQDLPFPEVSPESDPKSIRELALTFADKISDMAKDTKVTVHVMGEMNFTFNVVQLLQAKGIRCVASTTERCVEETENAKTSVFKFVRFREY